MITSDEGAGLPDGKDMKCSTASHPGSGTWLHESLSRPESSYSVLLNL